MGGRSSKVLISRRKINDNIKSDVNSLDLRQTLFKFSIGSDLSLVENIALPRLEERFHRNNTRLNINLEEGFEERKANNKLIYNIDDYRIHKWYNYLKCLQKHEIIAKEKPTIVCSDGMLSGLLRMNHDMFFAIKFKDVIHLFSRPLEVNEVFVRKFPVFSYIGLKFLYLVTNRDNSDINEFEKYFNVDRIDFKGNRLIVRNEIDGIDSSGNIFDAKCRQIFTGANGLERYYSDRLSGDWCQSVVRNVKTVIYGNRDNKTLKDIEVISVDTLPEKCIAYWSDTKYFSQLDQTLEFIKSCVESENRLYEFEFCLNDNTFSSYIHETNDNFDHFLPKFYTE